MIPTPMPMPLLPLTLPPHHCHMHQQHLLLPRPLRPTPPPRLPAPHPPPSFPHHPPPHLSQWPRQRRRGRASPHHPVGGPNAPHQVCRRNTEASPLLLLPPPPPRSRTMVASSAPTFKMAQDPPAARAAHLEPSASLPSPLPHDLQPPFSPSPTPHSPLPTAYAQTVEEIRPLRKISPPSPVHSPQPQTAVTASSLQSRCGRVRVGRQEQSGGLIATEGVHRVSLAAGSTRSTSAAASYPQHNLRLSTPLPPYTLPTISTSECCSPPCTATAPAAPPSRR
jgi:hypothetical protein